MKEKLANYRLPKTMRLHQYGVGTVLKAGRTVRASRAPKAEAAIQPPTFISIKLLSRAAEGGLPQPGDADSLSHARMAISVPKRLIKSAVDRNRFKRWVREAFRHHEIRVLPVDLLVSLIQRVEVANGSPSGPAQEAIKDALSQAKNFVLLPVAKFR